MVTAYIGIGSNLGDRIAAILKALTLLSDDSAISIEKISSLRNTKPVNVRFLQPDYINGVIKIKTDLSVCQLFDRLQEIERKLGRTRFFANAPRTIDLDMLLYGNATINESQLTVPHSRMYSRAFVLEPLCEIEPDLLQNQKRPSSGERPLNSL